MWPFAGHQPTRLGKGNQLFFRNIAHGGVLGRSGVPANSIASSYHLSLARLQPICKRRIGKTANQPILAATEAAKALSARHRFGWCRYDCGPAEPGPTHSHLTMPRWRRCGGVDWGASSTWPAKPLLPRRSCLSVCQSPSAGSGNRPSISVTRIVISRCSTGFTQFRHSRSITRRKRSLAGEVTNLSDLFHSFCRRETVTVIWPMKVLRQHRLALRSDPDDVLVAISLCLVEFRLVTPDFPAAIDFNGS